MARILITDTIAIDEDELSESFVLASGPGGQNVNKVSSAVQLRFDVAHSPSLPDAVRARLIPLCGQRLTKDGIVIIVARAHRTQERNRAEAREKLIELIARAATPLVPRRPTKPTKASKRRRLEAKTARAKIKRTRGKVRDE
ncbi:MAG TPA: alternative ribosome rescue aminoacyl-tRNA hydrolase ArfB [Micropepsaceae bacterium]|nr:alternative ribosome rescue aminoacyl-tRNA hydrolase ArfB [Micropepsaceae bacterium]